MRALRLQKRLGNGAQTASELAIFGAILIMVIGTLVSYSLLFNYSQNFQMLAFRQALLESHEIDRISASSRPNLSRRTASVVIIQDRNMPDLSSAFGIMSRSASGSSASATYNRHLSAEMEYGRPDDLPRVDFSINGQHFSFTTAGFKSDTCKGMYRMKKKVPIGTNEYEGGGTVGCIECPGDPSCSSTDIWWRWYICIDCYLNYFPPYESGNMVMDVDEDGKEEQILRAVRASTPCCTSNPPNPYCCAITGFEVLDYQDGEIDSTVNSYDISQGAKMQGALAEGSAEYHVEPGTQLVKDEDVSQITTTTTVKRTDIITRIIRLNRRHTDWTNVIFQANGVQGDCRGANAGVTCFESNDSIVGGPALFIRSNLKTDKPPQKWTIAK